MCLSYFTIGWEANKIFLLNYLSPQSKLQSFLKRMNLVRSLMNNRNNSFFLYISARRLILYWLILDNLRSSIISIQRYWTVCCKELTYSFYNRLTPNNVITKIINHSNFRIVCRRPLKNFRARASWRIQSYSAPKSNHQNKSSFEKTITKLT